MPMKTFFVGVKAVIVKDGKALLVRGDIPGRDFWDTPGGRIDDDESIAQTLDRELHEELPNIQSYTVGRLVYAERIHRDINGNVSLVLLFHEVNDVVFDGDPQVSQEHTEAKWIPLDEAIETSVSSVSGALKQIQSSR